jgi:hypothetical protein
LDRHAASVHATPAVVTGISCGRVGAAHQARAANDAHNRMLGVAVRARLCTALASVLLHGARADGYGDGSSGSPTLWELASYSITIAHKEGLAPNGSLGLRRALARRGWRTLLTAVGRRPAEETATGWANLAAHLAADPFFARDPNRRFRSLCCALLVYGGRGRRGRVRTRAPD